MDRTLIPQVRSFNRIAVERAGALNGRFLGRRRPVGEARLLWEIGADGADLRELRARLGLDSGYLSRLLRALERDGLVTVGPSSGDGRVRKATLTDRGREEWRELDTRSDAFAAGMLEPLGDRQQRELVDAMATVERYLTASMISVEVEDPPSRDALYCLEQYFHELEERFDDGFEEDFDVAADARRYEPPAGVLLLARLRGAAVGCGAIRFDERGFAEVKRMWVAPQVRGLGLGRRLLADLEARATAAGAPAVRLDTNRNLTEAIALYRAAGYHEIARYTPEPYAHHWFEKPL
ncbi:MAG TPA: MarR family winged helix-turn-helix transcriptional regulator [Gaiellales bacterium]|nr:MarR family winged helix-turn-helix transcriptional regulator [Gaiellales bacterium]